VIETAIERTLALDRADHGAEHGGHPQQRGEAPAESDAAECGEDDQNDQSQADANQDLR
jgi:hypothetical protein